MGSISPEEAGRPCRLAILECGKPPVDARARYGTYGGMFKALFIQNPNMGTGSFIAQTHYVYEDKPTYPKLSEIDALLITGSKDDAYANIPWINNLATFIAEALRESRIKIIGVCFGHQIIGRVLGVKVCKNELGWELGILPIDLSSAGKALFGKDSLSLQLSHQDIVTSVPDDVLNLGSTPACAVQGMYQPGKFVTLQGHPEFDERIMHEIIESKFANSDIDETTFHEATKRASTNNEGPIVGRIFERFLLSDEI